ncbi:HEAT repeat domain-containing protein [Breoghania sp.]|uniref:HEAT repeat domain-containing protein n=1 Tax=Breoghania sp. TaxID=2065378 RepID=UPI0029C6F605|nr:HEAT repeat domain-containing protein [Breoghania sp.]
MQSNKFNNGTPRGESLRTVLAWTGAVLLDGVAVCLVVSIASGAGRWVWIAATACHFGAAGVLLAFGFSRREAATRDRYRARLYGFLVLFLPVMGLVGSLILQLACERWICAHGLVEDFQEETAHRVIEPPRLDLQKDLTTYFDEELAVQPAMDILAGFDDDLKRGAIDTLRRIGTPEAVTVLKKCLSDKSTEVRHNAHTALTRLDETFVAAIKTAKKRLDTGVSETAGRLRYAKKCLDYAKSGLLDESTRRHYLLMARDSFLAVRGADMAAETERILNLGHLEIQLGGFDQAVAHFQSVLDKDPGNVKAMIGLAEAHYTHGDGKGLQTVAHRMQSARTTSAESASDGILLHFWATSPKGT